MQQRRPSWSRIAAGPVAVLAIVSVAAVLALCGIGDSGATPRAELAPASATASPAPTEVAPSPPSPSPTLQPEVAAAPAPPEMRQDRPPDDLLRYVSKSSEPLPAEYVPPDLVPLPPGLSAPAGIGVRAAVFKAFADMATAARAEGIQLVVVSGYRSYATQAAVYQEEIAAYGKVQADRQVALPGRSEHQLGTAVDISLPRLGFSLDDYLDTTPEGQWLERHAWEYGFFISYPKGKEEITGYRFEPWHYRYLGTAVARYMHNSGLTTTEVLSAHQSVGDDPVADTPPRRDPATCRGPLVREDC